MSDFDTSDSKDDEECFGTATAGGQTNSRLPKTSYSARQPLSSSKSAPSPEVLSSASPLHENLGNADDSEELTVIASISPGILKI